MAVSRVEFRTALRQFAAGVTVVTARDSDGQPVGLTVSAFTAVSLDPPLVLVCVDRQASAHPALMAHGWFGVSILGADQEDLSRRFAASGGDKFTGVTWHDGAGGVPLLAGVLTSLACRVVDARPAGDHTIFLGQVEAAAVTGTGSPLLYCRGAYSRLATAGGGP